MLKAADSSVILTVDNKYRDTSSSTSAEACPSIFGALTSRVQASRDPSGKPPEVNYAAVIVGVVEWKLMLNLSRPVGLNGGKEVKTVKNMIDHICSFS